MTGKEGSVGSFYRVGGDEFVIICHDVPKERFCQRVRELRAAFKRDALCKAAIGSQWTEKLVDVGQAVANADAQMYEDKKEFYRNNPLPRGTAITAMSCFIWTRKSSDSKSAGIRWWSVRSPRSLWMNTRNDKTGRPVMRCPVLRFWVIPRLLFYYILLSVLRKVQQPVFHSARHPYSQCPEQRIRRQGRQRGLPECGPYPVSLWR